MGDTPVPVPQSVDVIVSKKKEIFDYIKLRLADGIVDVELEQPHLEMAYKQAVVRYRQRAEHSVEESYAFLNIIPDVQEYILPQEVEDVRQIFRRGVGGLQGATQFEPFSSSFLNTYMLVAGRIGGLYNYELFVDYQKLTMNMFGGYMNFTFNRSNKKLTIVRHIPGTANEGVETVLLWIYNYKPESVYLSDPRIFPWIQDYAYSFAKHLLGEAREKFSQIVGPSGGTSLNGAALKAEAKEEMTNLITELGRYVDGSTPAWFVVG